jgi:hypothetical protein
LAKSTPISAILVASEVRFPNCSDVVFWHRLSASNQGRSCGSKRVAIGSRLCDEEAASRINLHVLRVHCHIASKEGGPTCRVKRERHEGTEGVSGIFPRQRGEGGDRHERHESPDTLSVGRLRQLRRCWAGGCVLAGCWFDWRHRVLFPYGVGWFRQPPPHADEGRADVRPIRIAEWKKGCNPAITGVTAIVQYKVYAAWMFEACIPLGPLVAS